MNEPLNGKPSQHVRVTLTQMGGAARLNYVTTDGKFLGTVTFDACDLEALQIMGNHFQQFATERAGGIQIAGANAVPGLRGQG